MWVFRCYISASGRNQIDRWYQRITPVAQSELDTVLTYLQQRQRSEWIRPQFAPLRGKYRELCELRFKANNLQHRVFGFFGPSQQEFTMLIGTTKKGRKYTPRNALDTALNRMNEVKNDETRTDIWNL